MKSAIWGAGLLRKGLSRFERRLSQPAQRTGFLKIDRVPHRGPGRGNGGPFPRPGPIYLFLPGCMCGLQDGNVSIQPAAICGTGNPKNSKISGGEEKKPCNPRLSVIY